MIYLSTRFIDEIAESIIENSIKGKKAKITLIFMTAKDL